MAVVRVEVRGLVQGVGFRWFAREAARRLGLAGWVRNRPDGAVEVAASGPDDSIQTFLDALRRGPSGARVDTLSHLATDELSALEYPFGVLR